MFDLLGILAWFTPVAIVLGFVYLSFPNFTISLFTIIVWVVGIIVALWVGLLVIGAIIRTIDEHRLEKNLWKMINEEDKEWEKANPREKYSTSKEYREARWNYRTQRAKKYFEYKRLWRNDLIDSTLKRKKRSDKN